MPRSPLFDQDDNGRTSLFEAALSGSIRDVEQILFRLTGTGMSPERLALINHKDTNGESAIDAAQKAGHQDIADLLAGEKGRMVFFG